MPFRLDEIKTGCHACNYIIRACKTRWTKLKVTDEEVCSEKVTDMKQTRAKDTRVVIIVLINSYSRPQQECYSFLYLNTFNPTD